MIDHNTPEVKLPPVEGNPNNNVLARVFRKLLHDLQVGPTRWDALMKEYVNNPDICPDSEQARISLTGNLGLELTRPEMTWKVFCKGLAVLQIEVATLNLVVTGKEGVAGEVAELFRPIPK